MSFIKLSCFHLQAIPAAKCMTAAHFSERSERCSGENCLFRVLKQKIYHSVCGASDTLQRIFRKEKEKSLLDLSLFAETEIQIIN